MRADVCFLDLGSVNSSLYNAFRVAASSVAQPSPDVLRPREQRCHVSFTGVIDASGFSQVQPVVGLWFVSRDGPTLSPRELPLGWLPCGAVGDS